MIRSGFLILLLSMAYPSWAEVGRLSLGGPFSDHMVIQRDAPVRIWGGGVPDASVSVTLGNKTGLARVDRDGSWIVELPPSGPTPLNQSLVLEVVSGSDRLALRDVVCGDVWLCAGQSNMRYTLGRREDMEDPASPRIFAAELEKAAHPRIRLLSVSAGQERTPPARKWSRCEPGTVAGFSAIGYFFGVSMLESLGIPVGLIDLGKGGQSLRAFLPEDLIKKDSRLAALRQSAPEKYPGAVHTRDVCWLAPYSLRGVLWYQGESDITRADDYPAMLRVMVDRWRSDFRQPELPFFVIELPGYLGKKNDPVDQRLQAKWRPRFREAQAKFVADTPHTFLVLASDLGEPHEIHPRDKKPLADRLSDAARRAMSTPTPDPTHTDTTLQ